MTGFSKRKKARELALRVKAIDREREDKNESRREVRLALRGFKGRWEDRKACERAGLILHSSGSRREEREGSDECP